MRTRRAVIAVGLLVSAAVTYALARGYVHGVAGALVERAHGQSRFLYLGCTYSPRNPFEERRDALLAQKYHLNFGVIGGIGPTNHDVQYQIGNNVTTWGLLRMRYGSGFMEKVEEQAHRETRVTRSAR
jgi:hypothetical protein